MSKCEVESEIIDELYDNPQTGDEIIYSLIGASLMYERTLRRNGDTISYEESDLIHTMEQFRNRIIKNLDLILAVRLAPR